VSGRKKEHATTRKLGVREGAEIWAVRGLSVQVVRGADRGRAVEIGVEGPVSIGTDPGCDLVLSDDSVSQRHAEISLEAGSYLVRDLGSTNGTRVGGVLVREVLIDAHEVTLSLGETDLRVRAQEAEVEHRLSLTDRFGALVGRAPLMRRTFELLARAAEADTTVLICGESGTGKELLAEELHARSARAAGPLVVLDCSSLSPGLAGSELFGHVRGAFTGALDSRVGAFEEARGGTLFLDEIGELPLEQQPALLRALAEREIKPIGSDRYQPIDVRVVAATHRDLARAIGEGRFRADLYYRIAVLRVTVPPLRQRREDLPALAAEFIRQLRPESSPEAVLTPGLLSAFTAYHWPGNVRELRNTIERLLVVGDAGELTIQTPEVYAAARRRAIDRFERDYVAALLADSGGVIARAAVRAGISRQMFHRLVRRHGVPTPDDPGG
jgi:two-component system response regulator GlrR